MSNRWVAESLIGTFYAPPTLSREYLVPQNIATRDWSQNYYNTSLVDYVQNSHIHTHIVPTIKYRTKRIENVKWTHAVA